MIRFVAACVLSVAVAFPSMAALKEGDRAPDFRAPASRAGNAFNFSLGEALKKGPVVVYFFPAAFTEACNVQAHEFAVHHDKFVAAGATVIGVSLDDISRLNAFSADPQYCGGKVPVASDMDGRIAGLYDLKITKLPFAIKDTRGATVDHGFAERTTFVVTQDGKIAATIGGLAPQENVAKALETVQKLAAKRAPK